MAEIVMTGGGIVGLTTAMLLADDGHEVTVLERDPAPVPDPADAWDDWERRGVNQFRLPHFLLARFRREIERELPRVAKALDAAGALRFNPVALAPESFTGGWREGDEEFEALTGRRAVVESVVAREAQSTAGVTVRRGVACNGLLPAADLPARKDTLQVVGVRTDTGEEMRADLVVDASGRRSALPQWLDQLGARPLDQHLEDSGFVYYGRHFRSADGSVPPSLGPGVQPYGTITTLTLPCDNGTWTVVIVASAKDGAIRGVLEPDRFEAVFKSLPLVAHWLDGEPLEERVVVMAKIEDRRRRLVVDGEPVAAGVVPLADAWACTNPSVGRGVSIGTLHALALRKTLRENDPGDRVSFAKAFDRATEEEVEPWFRETLEFDQHRLAEMDAEIAGRAYEPDDRSWELGHCLAAAAGRDPDVLRASVSNGFLLRSMSELLAQPGLEEKIVSLGSGWREIPRLGPDRAGLLSLVSG